MPRKIEIGNASVGGGKGPLLFIAGPCVIEDEKTTLKTLEGLLDITERLGVGFVFKASYDKANRTSIDSYRGPGLKKGLKLFEKIKKRYDVAVLTDVHSVEEAREAGKVVDALQIPAFLCRQTDLLVAAGKTKKPVNIKKGQFMNPASMAEAVRKVESTGNKNVFLTERGVSFGYSNLVVDFRSIPIMRQTGCPVIFDSTHSVQLPSAKGKSSGGDRSMIAYLSRAAVAVGVDGIFMETHPNPDKALSDGPNSIPLKDAQAFMEELSALDGYIRGSR
ncbi:MAG: 3-deoxy-8-phosphooctulonate synthase [Deltaproteobacteria bacterium]|nr:3-deoxy-8-phosphooctulonate synthase [Deltaproteobacteria bacterium]